MGRVAPSVMAREQLHGLLAGGVDRELNIISALVEAMVRLMVQERHCCVRGWEQRLSCLVDERRSLCRPVGRALGVRRVPVSAGGDHLGGAVVSALRTLLP